MQTLKAMRHATVAVMDLTGSVQGTGILITKAGHVITCWHVFELCQGPETPWEDFKDVLIKIPHADFPHPIRAALLYPVTNGSDRSRILQAIDFDLVLLKLTELPQERPNIPYCEIDPILENLEQSNREVTVIGYSRSEFAPEGFIEQRQIVTLDLLYDPMEGLYEIYLQTLQNRGIVLQKRSGIMLNEHLAPGTSGGPVFHEETKQVIGLVCISVQDEYEKWAMAIPSNIIIDFLTEANETLDRDYNLDPCLDAYRQRIPSANLDEKLQELGLSDEVQQTLLEEGLSFVELNKNLQDGGIQFTAPAFIRINKKQYVLWRVTEITRRIQLMTISKIIESNQKFNHIIFTYSNMNSLHFGEKARDFIVPITEISQLVELIRSG